MQKEARVIALNDDKTAELAVRRDTACGDCATCGGCSANVLKLRVSNSLDAKTGDMVLIETSSGAVIGISALVYLLPLIMFFAGYVIGAALGIMPLVFAAVGFLLPIIPMILISRKLSGKIQYRMVKILEER